MKTLFKITILLLSIILYISCIGCSGGGSADGGTGDGGEFQGSTESSSWDTLTWHTVTDLEMINSCQSGTRFDILVPGSYSGSLSYIASVSELGITTKDEFDTAYAASGSKGTETFTVDSHLYNDYVRTGSYSAGRDYYVYVLDSSDNIYLFTGTTLTSDAPVTNPEDPETGKLDAGTVGEIEYTITYPDGYNKDGSKTWPIILAMKASNFTANNKKLPCITFYTSYSGYNTTVNEVIKDKINEMLEDGDNYKIDKNRIYGIGYSAGGDSVMNVASRLVSEGSYSFRAIAAIGTGGPTMYNTDYKSNLKNVNIWLFCGGIGPDGIPDNSSTSDDEDGFAYHTISFYNSMISYTTADLRLTIMDGLDHSESRTPPLISPYTFMWLLSKH